MPTTPTPETISVGTIIWIILAMGMLGGLANFLSTRTTDDDWWHFWKCVVCGIAAAVVVPLFLQTIQSDLMDKLGKAQINYLVFAGFCLLAAFASRTFLDSLAEKALKTANEAEAKSKAAAEKADATKARTEEMDTDLKSVKEEVKPLTERFTENTPASTASAQDPAFSEISPTNIFVEQAGPKHVIAGIDHEGLKVLNALASPKYTFRTVEGIEEECKLPRHDVTSKLRSLKQSGFANHIKRENGARWYITAEGRNAILNPHLPKTLISEPAQEKS